LEALGNRYPNLVFELSLSDRVEDLLRHEADIAIRMAEVAQDALIALRIGGMPFGLHAHRRYLEQHGLPKTIDDITSHRLIGYDRESAFARTMRKRYPLLGRFRPVLKVDSYVAQMALIRSACGIGFCQIGLARRNPDIVRVLEQDFAMTMETYVVMHENFRTTPRCRVTFDAIADGMNAYLKS
jgi:DNA-binding transcriptional LysR family regulator